MKRAISAILLCVFFAGAAGVAIADSTLSWMGTVAYLNNSRLGIKSESEAQTKDFMLTDATEVYENGKKVAIGDLKVGELVKVQYNKSTMFGATRASRIDIVTFSKPKPLPTQQFHVAAI